MTFLIGGFRLTNFGDFRLTVFGQFNPTLTVLFFSYVGKKIYMQMVLSSITYSNTYLKLLTC